MFEPTTAKGSGKAETMWKKAWHSWGMYILVFLGVLIVFRTTVVDMNRVPSASMNPTLLEGDRIVVNRLAYGLKVPFTERWLVDWAQPQRGDVIVFDSPTGGGLFVKRVVGLPGDQIEVTGGRLFINGNQASYEPAEPETVSESLQRYQLAWESLGGQEHSIMTVPGSSSPSSFGPVHVPEGCYFLMGDNRDNSKDSRCFGCVERRAIFGRVTAVAISLDPAHCFLPRWRRFLCSMP
jgi:signal peptidase I